MATYEEAIDAAASLHDQYDDVLTYVESLDEPSQYGYREYLRGQTETLARLFPVVGMTTSDRAEQIERDVLAMVKAGTSTR